MRKTKQKFNTMVLDPEKGFALEDVYVKEPEKDKTLGRMWRYGKSLVHLVIRDGKNLIPVELPAKMGETPEKLYRALYWGKETDILFSLKSPWYEKMKTIGIFILIGIELLFIFLIFNSL